MGVNELGALGTHVREQLEPALATAPDDALRAALSRRASQAKARRAPWVLGTLGIATACAALFGLWPATRGAEPPPLTFTVGTPAATGVVARLVTAPEGTGTSLRFSEGSRIALDPGATARVAHLDQRGAEVVLEGGRAHVDVVPRAGNGWRVRTGPFVVHVTGTRFNIAWDAARDAFSLELFEGSVVLSGCTFGAGRALAAGQRADASCRSGALSIRALGRTSERAAPEREPVSPPSPVAAATTPDRYAKPSPQDASPRNAAPAPAFAASWQSLAEAGRYEQAYARVHELGFAAECGRRGVDEVLLLGETASLSGHLDDARSAYQIARARFPASAAAARAAFQLGRLEDRAGRRALAAEWFEMYLSEAPNGAFSAAARGRLLEARVALGDTVRARAAAQAYLERHPNGAHAEAAAKLLEPATRGSK